MLTVLHPHTGTHLISLDTAQMYVLSISEEMHVLVERLSGRRQSISVATHSGDRVHDTMTVPNAISLPLIT